MSPRRKKPFKLDLSMDPETRKGVFTVLLFFISLLILLAMFGLAGRFGDAVDGAVTQIFGWDKIVVPFFLIAWGYHLMAPEKLPMKATNFIGFALFFVSLVVSALFADNGYRAFWGDIERGVGVFGFMHFYLFVILALAFFKDKDWDWF